MLTLSSSDRVAFSAPSGRPNGKQYLEKSQHVNIRPGVSINISSAMNMLSHICSSNSLVPILVLLPLSNFQKGLMMQMEESKTELGAVGKVS